MIQAIETENLAAHVSICEQRYLNLEARLNEVERRIENIEGLVEKIHNKIDSMAQNQETRWDASKTAIIGALAGLAMFLLGHLFR